MYNGLYGYNFLSFYYNLFDFLSNVRNFLNYLPNSLLDDNFLLDSYDFLNYNFLDSLSDDFLNNLWHLNDFLDDFSDRYNLFDNLFDRNWDLNRYNDLSLDLNWCDYLNCVVDYFFNLNLSWNFTNDFDYFFDDNLIIDYLLFIPWNLN